MASNRTVVPQKKTWWGKKASSPVPEKASSSVPDKAEKESDLQLKLLIVGDGAVGKTGVFLRYTKDIFDPMQFSTPGVDYGHKTITTLEGKKIKLEIWDTSGVEKYRSVVEVYYPQVNGIILVYDITRQTSFDSILELLKIIKAHAPADVKKLLIGNKCDLKAQRIVDTEKGENLALALNIPFLETSARTNYNIIKAFEMMANLILKKQMNMDVKKSGDMQLDITESQPVSTHGSNLCELESPSAVLQSKIEDLLSENEKLKKFLTDKDLVIQSLHNIIQEKERIIQKKDCKLKKRLADKELNIQSDAIQEMDRKLKKRLADKELETQSLSDTIQEKERIIQEKDCTIQENIRTIQEKNHTIQQKNFSIQTLTSIVDKCKQRGDESWLQLSHISTITWSMKRSIIKSIPQCQIGKGAWGEVYSATYNGQPVAIKYVHEALLQTKGTLEMIKREISIMARIQHPNLVRFIGAVLDEDVDSKRDVPIIVLELLDINLRVAYSTETLEQTAMLPIFCDVAYALHYLHEQIDPIIHRDISAPNVLLKRLPNQSFQAKVSDFGSANLLKQSVTAGTGAIIYTAPEMFPQEDITVDPPEQTVKVDVFSYGIVLLEVVCVEMPAIEKRSALLRSCKSKWKEIYDLIVQCTKRSAEERPTMREILYSLHGI